MAKALRSLSEAEVPEFERYVDEYCRVLRQLEMAVAAGDAGLKRHLIGIALRSYAGKVTSMVLAACKDDGQPIQLPVIKIQAGSLNLYRLIPEPVTLLRQIKPDGKTRIIESFRRLSKASQIMCLDILKICLKPYDFDFMEEGRGGENAAATRLKEFFEGGNHAYGVVADVRNCFGSVRPEGLAQLLPLPAPVVRNVLLAQGNTVILPPIKGSQQQGTTKEVYGCSSPTTTAAFTVQADASARQGLPQGSKVSNLVVSRRVIGPALAEMLRIPMKSAGHSD